MTNDRDGMPGIPKDPEPRWRGLARRFWETLATLDEDPSRLAPAGDAAPSVHAAEHGVALSALFTGLTAARTGAPEWRRVAVLPRISGPVSALLEPLVEIEGEGYEAIRVAARPAYERSLSGDEAGARAALADLPPYEVVFLPPWLKARVGSAVAAARLARSARLVLAGRYLDAHHAFIEASLLGQTEAWALEALLSLVWLALEAGEPGREAAEAALGLLTARIDNATLEEESYHRYHAALARAGLEPSEAVSAFYAALRRPVRDRRQLERFAIYALERVPDSPFAHHLLGSLLYLEGDTEACVAHLGPALDAGREPARLLYGLALLREGRRDEGLDVLRPLLDAPKPAHEAVLAHAEEARRQGDRERASALLATIAQVGEPYCSRAATIRAEVLLDAGDRLAAHSAIHDARDACDDEAVRVYRRLAAAHAAAGDAERERISANEARAMAALPPVQRFYGFITNPLGQPLVVTRDPGGVTYVALERSFGRQVLVRVRPRASDEPRRPPAVLSAPWFLEVLAADSFGPRRHTVLVHPGGTPLARLRKTDRREVAAFRRPLLISLAAAATDAAGHGLVLGWVAPERIIVTAEGAPALAPFDPYDDPRPKDRSPPSPALAPEVVVGGAAAVSAASDVYGIGAIARSLFAVEDAIGPHLTALLDACTAPAPADRPSPLALLEALIAESF